MKRINNKIKSLFLIIVAFSLSVSCTKESLDELGVDPNNPTKANLDLLLTNAQADILGRSTANATSGLFGQNWDRYAGAFVQYFAGNHAIGVSSDQYILNASDFQRSFTVRYRTGLKDAKEIIDKGSAEGNWKHVGIAKILMATGLGYLTDVYGDIPYTEAFGGLERANPKYDSQEAIYGTVFKLLNEAITDLDKDSKIKLNNSHDIIYKGNLSKWKATAYLLLARYNNHLSKIDPSKSATDALNFIDKAIAGGFDGSYNYEYKYDGSTDWQNPWYTLYENNYLIASEKFMKLLKDTKDPRLMAYWDDRPYNYPSNNGVLGFVGKKNGLPTGSASYSPVGPNTFYGKKSSPILIATYFELKFIEAEAAMRSGDAGRASKAINEAVKAQIDLVTPSVVNLLTKEKKDVDAYKKQISEYKKGYASTKATDVSMEKIMTEKYKAMFTMNLESWTDLRRHDFKYPSNYLNLPENASLTEYIRRGLYPQNELDNNSDNVPKGISLTNRLWWDK